MDFAYLFLKLVTYCWCVIISWHWIILYGVRLRIAIWKSERAKKKNERIHLHRKSFMIQKTRHCEPASNSWLSCGCPSTLWTRVDVTEERGAWPPPPLPEPWKPPERVWRGSRKKPGGASPTPLTPGGGKTGKPEVLQNTDTLNR